MNIGRFEVEQLSEGIFEIFEDGDIRKTDPDHIEDSSEDELLRSSSSFVGIDPVLIRDGKHNILIDTGLGWGLDHRSHFENTSNLKTNLDIFGLSPDDITHVVLSHLHFDHSAGSTYVDGESRTQVTMPYANYFIQKKEWYFALEQMEHPTDVIGAGYNLDELYKLMAEEKLVMITDASFELIPGIKLIRTGGHTPGHQIVKIEDQGETAYYLGDLVPTEFHLNQYSMRKMDIDPLQAKKAKTLILRQALEENAYLLFYHSIHTKSGRLDKDKDRNLVLRKER
ncbi:MBL fold metallo-hydrolase [Balneola sp. MJW-20]|uniref:MBL fold metallo-hydrolase n=1 Tax=Gracilimonas aurantiaca TaxID=3234185 RepID=UPI00346593F7